MKSFPKISIGISAYKEQFLADAIKSVLDQSFEDYELIIINDNPGSNIENIVHSFNDKRIKYFENSENIGGKNLIGAWNNVLNKAMGELFVLFSDDDFYEPNFLEELYNLSLKYPKVDIFHCRVRQVDENNSVMGYTSTAPEWETVIDFLYHRICLGRINYISDFLFRTKKLKEISGFADIPLAWGSDIATCCLAAKENGIVYSSKPLFNYRYSPISLTSSDKYLKKVDGALIFQNWVNEFLSTITTQTKSLNEIAIIVNKGMNDFTIGTIINALLKSSSKNYKGFIPLLKNWYSVKGKIPHKNRILLKSIILYLKRAYENIN